MATTPPLASVPTHSRSWAIVWGIVLIVIGVLALIMPGVAALATALTLAWLLIFAGIIEVVHAVQTRRSRGFGWKLAGGIATLLLGFCILVFPVAGIASLALLLGALLFAGGVIRLMLAYHLKPVKGWGWVLADGVLSVVVAILIVLGWPGSSIAFIGLLAGFWLLFAGIWHIMLDGRAPAA
jgi:uncharacterized membrane protein HdeD (DUF308 family)